MSRAASKEVSVTLYWYKVPSAMRLPCECRWWDAKPFSDHLNTNPMDHHLQVVGYFPSYLRQVFLKTHEASQLPPLPPTAKEARGPQAPDGGPKSVGGAGGYQLELAMDPMEAKRKLAWMFAPTPPLIVRRRPTLNPLPSPTEPLPPSLTFAGEGARCWCLLFMAGVDACFFNAL